MNRKSTSSIPPVRDYRGLAATDPVVLAMNRALAKMARQERWIFISESGTTREVPAQRLVFPLQALRRSGRDTGSPEVQAVYLSEKVTRLTEHLRTHPRDESSRRGLVMTVAKRRRLLTYLKQKDVRRHREALSTLNLRK